MSRPILAQVNLAALRANVARVRALAPDAQVLAVVKARVVADVGCEDGWLAEARWLAGESFVCKCERFVIR